MSVKNILESQQPRHYVHVIQERDRGRTDAVLIDQGFLILRGYEVVFVMQMVQTEGTTLGRNRRQAEVLLQHSSMVLGSGGDGDCAEVHLLMYCTSSLGSRA